MSVLELKSPLPVPQLPELNLSFSLKQVIFFLFYYVIYDAHTHVLILIFPNRVIESKIYMTIYVDHQNSSSKMNSHLIEVLDIFLVHMQYHFVRTEMKLPLF